MKKRTQLLVVMLLLIYSGIAQQNFDVEKDFLLLNNDTQADPDDIHSIAAVASFLQHPDLCGVQYFGVIGTNKGGNSNFLPRSVELAQLVYGTENVDWANANKEFGDRLAARNLVANRIKPIIDNGGTVWVAEAGQADFTYDVLMRLKDLGVAESKFKNQIVIVQHSEGNENTSTDQKINYLRANTDYRKIDNGNLGGNNTPRYIGDSKTFLNEAKSAQNPNPATREYWTLTDDIVDAWNVISNHRNTKIRNGGVDFSDATEVWYIFSLGNSANTVRAVWDNYVLREPTNDPCTPIETAISFQSPVNTEFEEGADLGVIVSVDEGSVSNIKLYFNDVLVRQENSAPFQWGIAHTNQTVDPSLLNLSVGTYELKAVATDSQGASVITIKNINVVASTLSVDENRITGSINMYPNPVQNSLFVSNNTSDKLIRIYNVLGAVQITKELKGERNEIDLSALPAGLYLVHITELSKEKSAGSIYRIMKIKM